MSIIDEERPGVVSEGIAAPPIVPDALPLTLDNNPAPGELKQPYQERVRPYWPAVRRVVGKLALFGALTAGSAIGVGTFGVLNSPSTAHIGPVVAEITPTFDRAVTIDAGLPKLGDEPNTITLPLKRSPHNLGAHVKPVQILTGSKTTSLEDFLTDPQTAKGFANLLADNKHTTAIAQEALWRHWLGWAEAGGAVGLGLGLGLYELLGAERRQELRHYVGRPQQKLAAMTLALVLFSGGVNIDTSAAVAKARAIPADHIFDGTPAVGAHVNGAIGRTVIEKLIPPVLNYMSENKAFYSGLHYTFDQALKTHPLLQATPNTITVEVTSDQHCNMNMNEFIGQVAHQAHVNLVATTGDNVIGGSLLDGACLSAYYYHLKGIPVVSVDGNHAPANGPAKQKGITNLEGKIQEVGGVRYLGDANRDVSVFGYTVKQVGAEDNLMMGHRLANLACTDPNGVNVIMGATMDAIRETLQRGCAQLGLSGGRESTLVWVTTSSGDVVPLFKVGTAGGAGDEQITLGPLQNPAHLALIQIDKATHRPLYEQSLGFYPDGSVDIGDITSWSMNQYAGAASTTPRNSVQ